MVQSAGMRIDHSIDIAAPIDRVWALTVDIESLPELTPTLTSVERLDEGPLRVASTARVRQPAQPPRVWTVTDVEPTERFAWTTGARGLRMTAIHELTPSAGGTRNTLSVVIEGRLGRLVGRLLRGRIARALATENEGFKRHAETEPAASV